MLLVQHLPHHTDEGRVGSAAAAEQVNPQRKVFLHTIGKFCSIDGIAAGQRVGQTGIWLDKDGQRGVFPQLSGEGEQLHRTQRAVKADSICAQSLDDRSHRRNAAAGEGPSVCFKSHRYQHRKFFAKLFAAFLSGKDGSLDLIEVGHRFNDNQVYACLYTGIDLLGKEVISLLEGKGAGRLHQLADGTDVQSNQRVLPRCRLFGTADSSRNDLLRCISAASQLFAVGAEGVGVQDVRSGFQIFPMDLGDQLRFGDAAQLGD